VTVIFMFDEIRRRQLASPKRRLREWAKRAQCRDERDTSSLVTFPIRGSDPTPGKPVAQPISTLKLAQASLDHEMEVVKAKTEESAREMRKAQRLLRCLEVKEAPEVIR